MIEKTMRQAAQRLDLAQRRRRNLRLIERDYAGAGAACATLEPVWPLPRRARGPSDEQIRAEFARFPNWHYGYAFEGGLRFATNYESLVPEPERPLRRFRHFMPWLLDACGGSLAGKRVLDIACNSGFWSLQCALLGAEEVVGFDAREELVEQARLLKAITGVDNADFRTLDFWEMTPAAFGGRFDVVLNLGLLYHLPKPLQAMELTRAMARDVILLDTALVRSERPVGDFRWEEPKGIRSAADAGVVVYPSAPAVELMLRHLGVKSWQRIPLRSRDMPNDYLTDGRGSWIIRV